MPATTKSLRIAMDVQDAGGCSLKGRSKLRNRVAAVALITLAFLLTVPAFAQNNTGIISGRITDPAGAVVPNVHITVTHVPTNVDWASETNTDGLFRIPGLPDGPYKMTVTATGFKKLIREGFSLRIGENLDIELKLEV